MERERREDHHRSGAARQPGAWTNENFCRAVLSSQAANSADVIGVFSNIDQGKYTILTSGLAGWGDPPPVSLKYPALSRRNDRQLTEHLLSTSTSPAH